MSGKKTRNTHYKKWSQIIVYDEDKKVIKKYDLNEKQKLLNPPKPMRRRHLLIPCFNAELKNEDPNKINDSQDPYFQQDYSKKQEGKSEKKSIWDENMELIDRIFGKVPFDSFMEEILDF